MQFELSELQEKVGITFVTVTHDQDEALSMACRIAVINKGDVSQLATPSGLYEYPANRFVADFVGSVNIFEGKLSLDEPDKAAVDCPGLGKIYLNHGVTGPHGADVWVALRSEEHTSELQSLMRISYAVFCLKKKKNTYKHTHHSIE